MAHLILENDNMISGNNKTPWHGLGEVKGVVTIADAYRVLGWHVTKEQLQTQSSELVDTYCTIRHMPQTNGAPTKRIILGDKLSDQYEILQNADLINAILPLTQAGCQVETLGSLENGACVWVMLRLSQDLLVGNSDTIKRYILVSNRHDGKASAKFGVVGTRVVCANTLHVAETTNSKLLRIRHKGSVSANLNAAVELLDHVNGQFLAYGGQMESLMARKDIVTADIKKYVKEVFFPKLTDKELDEKRDKVREMEATILDNFTNRHQGAETVEAKGTAYGLYQAANYYLNHQTRGGQVSLAWGGNALVDRRALAVAKQLVAV